MRSAAGEVYFEAENPKGALGFFVVSKGGGVPWRLKIRSPSFCNLSILPKLCTGVLLSDVVAILGDVRASGPIGNSAVAILGNTYVNTHVDGDVVAVLGSVELGPDADVQGEVVSIGGGVTRAQQARVARDIKSLEFGSHFNGAQWLRPWIANALLYARPLAVAPGLTWAWVTAGAGAEASSTSSDSHHGCPPTGTNTRSGP